MQYSKLGSSNLSVSRICLGSMTWGIQNCQQEANQQIDFAINQGVNFIDTAEMYPVPPDAQSSGQTEVIIGNWLNDNKEKRQDLVIATKIAGAGLPWIRDGVEISSATVIEAVDKSLQRLQTDYIDLYQLHWPNRTSPHFGKHWPNKVKFSEYDAQDHTAQMLDILEGLAHCQKAGKIRHCGLSDDTPWGLNTYLKLADKYDLPKMVSIQNEFNLLHTKDWPYLIENCLQEDVAYLPWSPLAGGMLSGKYLNGERPAGSRWTLLQRNGLFRDTQNSHNAISEYCDIAKAYDLTPSQLALAWCDQIDGVTSTIIGATNMAQLKENILAFENTLPEQALFDIAATLKRYPVPF